MKKIKPLLILFVLYSTIASAQVTKESKNNDVEILEVSKTIDKLSHAMVDRDGTTLQKLMLDELTYGHSSGKLENKIEFIDAVVNGAFDFITLETKEQTIFISGEDTAVARHIFESEALNAGEPVEIRIGNLMILKKIKNQWKILARQAYKL